MFIDIDNFKHINDTWRHDAGDECLKAIGQLAAPFGLQNNITFYRYGSEEIVGICHAGKEAVSMLAQELLKQLSALRVHHGSSDISLTASIGYAPICTDLPKMIRRRTKQCMKQKNMARIRLPAWIEYPDKQNG
ncbi:MAG: GGDEF domain-containing protein [Erysipelotrichaceae bacterium]|jgi:diguanylate cyclase (GGDEF)-like protein|nr:GGDEF domain-containing protein [Erysipelotrichaceae bacterium]MCI1326381.1 GGDEF domain-containing protein [Solobacterium sp.]MCH4044500.1 GGDEF domain-containing protein [Erysipelotrichaceae bacterium]MCH4121712.1 GGDEF domain-containing protein [Erysipelotrichaceae bacterium]MCI1362912.1 GGDEF domain-containing protein [Solobacterium sp.]